MVYPPLTEWIQTEQSVVVSGYGAFVVNNIPDSYDPDLADENKILQVSLMGPAKPTSVGAERFQWDTASNSWSSAWARSDVSSTSMVPIHSQSANMALINGYRDGWEVLGLDWNTGETVHQTKFGDVNFGNGAYAILQYLDNSDLVFDSIAGPIRVHHSSVSPDIPVASFTTDVAGGVAPLTVTFTDTSTNSPTSWAWDFGDGDTTNATEQNPVHTFAAAGTYAVKLTASNTAGSGEATQTITVTDGPVPAPEFPLMAFPVMVIGAVAFMVMVYRKRDRENP